MSAMALPDRCTQGSSEPRQYGRTMTSPSPAGASSCLFRPLQRVGMVDGFVGAVSTAEVKGEGDVAGGGAGAGTEAAVFEGWLRMP